MDQLQRAWFDMKFELSYLKSKGEAFQDFFASIMGRCHPNDFIKVRPWGNVGDRKNDGYLQSERMLFQCYAPNEMTAASAINKINEDFIECLPHWQEHFGEWVFVHNSDSGLGPHITARLLELGTLHTPLRVSQWGLVEIQNRFRRLDLNDCVALYGLAPTQDALTQVRAADIAALLTAITISPEVAIDSIHPVPADKLDINDLSSNAAILLEAGRRKAPIVELFFAKHPDPRFGDQVAEAFKQHYRKAREQQFLPDAIFDEMLIYAGYNTRGHQVSALALVAHLFDSCDIFEATRG